MSKISIFLLMFLGVLSCTPPKSMDLLKESIIPVPVSVIATNSSFAITGKTNIYIQQKDFEKLKSSGKYFADLLSLPTGFAIQVKASEKMPRSGNFYFCLSEEDTELGDEGYELIITEKLVKLSAARPAGIFRGIQTMRQLLPARIEQPDVQEGLWLLATGIIRDFPEYSFRGSMLDVSRHFFSVDEVKRYIDLLAYYKLNVLHLHLSDDQGWRIEIKSWPKLTVHGGSTEVGGGDAGFYTQEEYKEIVRYAGERYITIIPEIDMPGHTNAALASYAELNCNGKATDLYTGTKVGFSTLCTGKEVTYQFIDNVIGELAAMTPGPYIHIGGDESHVTPLKDYIPFINRVQEIVRSHGKQVIGWDEIAHASLKENTVVQFWARAENARKGNRPGGESNPVAGNQSLS